MAETGQAEKDRELRQYLAKQKASKISILAISVLILMKALASAYTGSIGIRADAIHSAIDLVGVIIGFIGIRVSGRPADREHTFGHDKAENIAGFAVTGLILIAAALICYEAITKLIYGGTLELVDTGIYVTVGALAINVILARYIFGIAKSTESVALEATGRDILADALSSVAVLIGLVLVRVTGLEVLDPIVALLVATLIARTAYRTMRKSFEGLMDMKLPESEEAIIREAIMEHGDIVAGFHKLRTRKAGSRRFIDFHLVLPRDYNLDEAHKLCDHLEEDIGVKLQGSNVTIHIEPCPGDCDQCPATCVDRQ